MPETHFDAWIARSYARLWPVLFDAQFIDSTVAFLAAAAGGGAALELGIGTGRIALLAGRARPDGATGGQDALRALVRLAAGVVHQREPRPHLSLAQIAGLASGESGPRSVGAA
ncbi:MAG: hypothetical protein JO057_23275 [Chloroflexi bacterium]|nr:hypothetical protein [Chloroflexota bacterium]